MRLAPPSFAAIPSTSALAAFAESRSGIRRIALARRAAAAKNLTVRARGRSLSGVRAGHRDKLRQPKRRGRESASPSPAAFRFGDRNQGEITRARGALDAADRELESFDRVSLARSIEGRRQQVVNLQARADSFRDDVIPAYRAAYDAARAQFRAGQASTLQLFEVQKSLVEAQEKAFEYAVEALPRARSSSN
jgi:hypothetical protein